MGVIDFSSSNVLVFSDGVGINSDISVKLVSGISLFGLLEVCVGYMFVNVE